MDVDASYHTQENVRTMDKAIEDYAVPDQQNKEYVEAQVLPEKTSNAPEDLDVETSAHPEVNKDHDAESSAHPEGPEDLDSYSSFLPEGPEYHEVLGAGARYREETQKTPYYDITMDSDVSNIDRNDKNTYGTIYEAIDAPSFVQIKLFTRAFINICQKHPNEPLNIPTDINKNILKQSNWNKFYTCRW